MSEQALEPRTGAPITLHFSPTLVRRAVRAFWWQKTGWGYFGALALGCALLIYLWSTGERSWTVGVLGSVLLGGLIVAIAMFVVHARSSMGRLRRMRVPEATLEVSDTGLRLASDMGSSEIKWNAVIDLWQFPDFWLLFLSRAQFITIPTADLPPDVRTLILSEVRRSARQQPTGR